MPCLRLVSRFPPPSPASSLFAPNSYQFYFRFFPLFLLYFVCFKFSSNDINALGRTARERWKLFKNVAKLGLQRAAVVASTSTPSSPTGESIGSGSATTSDAVDTETEINGTSTENMLVADEEDEQYNLMPAVSMRCSCRFCCCFIFFKYNIQIIRILNIT